MENLHVLKAKQELHQFQGLHSGDRKIVFYAATSWDWLHFEPIIRELISDRGGEICYITSDINDPILEKPLPGIKSFFIGYGDSRTEFFKFLDVRVLAMTMPDLEQFYIKRSQTQTHYVYIFQSLISTHMGYIKGAFDNYDSILCAGTYHVSEIREAEQLYGLSPKKLVECGYGHLDNIIQNYSGETNKKHNEKESLRVVIAPTYGPQSLSEIFNSELCVELIEILLDAGLHVTMRPHWMTSHTNPEAISVLKSRFSENMKFVMEHDILSISSLKNSDVLISDVSGITLEYAFGFLKPVIYIDLPPRVRNVDFDSISMPAIELELREETGVILSPDKIKEAPRVIKEILKEDSGFKERCKSNRNQWIFNIGRSGKIAADHIEALVAEEDPVSNEIDAKALHGLYQFRKLPVEKRKIVFYANAASDWLFFEAIIRELIFHKKQNICYVTSDPKDPVLERKNPAIEKFFVGCGNSQTDFFDSLEADVLVMTKPNLNHFFIKCSRFPVHYVYVFQTLISTHMGQIKGAFDHYDSILCAGPHHVDEIRASEKIYGLPPKQLIECGYGHLDNILENWAKNKQADQTNIGPVKVVIAPTYGPQSLIEIKNGMLCAALIDTLIKADFHVTLRPHWMTLHSPALAEIKKRFTQNRAFTLEESISSSTSLVESDIMVSDFSGAALEYAFGFLKPVVYVDIPPRTRNSEYTKFSLPVLELELRQETGFILSPEHLEEAPGIINEILHKESDFPTRCKSAREKWVFNPGKSGKIGAEHITNIVESKHRDLQSLIPKTTASSSQTPILQMNRVSVVFPNQYVGLHPTDLEFYPGELTILLGPSRSGKSILLRTLNGLVPCSTGHIHVKDLGNLTDKQAWSSHQRRTAMIHQENQLIQHYSAMRNVLMGRIPHRPTWRCLFPWSDKDKRIALDCLDRVGLLKKARIRITHLNQRQQQLVNIARALAQQPAIILADEPVRGFDPTTSEGLLALLKKVCEDQNISLIVSLHQAELAKNFADRIICISQGLVVSDGFPEDITMEKLRIIYGTDYKGPQY